MGPFSKKKLKLPNVLGPISSYTPILLILQAYEVPAARRPLFCAAITSHHNPVEDPPLLLVPLPPSAAPGGPAESTGVQADAGARWSKKAIGRCAYVEKLPTRRWTTVQPLACSTAVAVLASTAWHPQVLQ